MTDLKARDTLSLRSGSDGLCGADKMSFKRELQGSSGIEEQGANEVETY